MNLVCVLLAAGNSKRFGGNKLMYAPENDGVPMAFKAIDLHKDLCYSEKILVTRENQWAIREYAENNGYRVLINPAPEAGISGSIVTASEYIGRELPNTEGILFGVCDQPRMQRATIEKLMKEFDTEKERICITAFDGRRGNPVIFPAAYIIELCELQGDLGGSAVIRRHPDKVKLVSAERSEELEDIDYRPHE